MPTPTPIPKGAHAATVPLRRPVEVATQARWDEQNVQPGANRAGQYGETFMEEHIDHQGPHGMTHSSPEHGEHAAPMHEHHAGRGGHHDHHAHMVADFRKRFWISLVLTLPILALSPGLWSMLGLGVPLTFRGDHYVLFGFSSVVFFYGGWPFLKGFGEVLRKRQPGMMTLIAVAISAAYFHSSAVTFGLSGMGFYWELATLIDIMLLGHWIEMKSVLGASGALEALVRLLPSEAHRLLADGNTEDVSVDDITPGDKLLVKPGERVPTDGIIVSGQTSLDESMLTGESKPVEKGEGAEAIGGSVNGEGAITLEVKKTGGQTYLAQVMDMVSKAQESRSRTQDLANRAAVWLTAIALGGGIATLVVWLALGRDFAFAMARAVTVKVIACPHALGLAVPLVMAINTSMAASHGLLIRDRAAFERARNLGAVVFDKTGTLTEGRFGVSDIVPLGDLDETACLRLAAALESQSEHPIAAGIVRTAKERQVESPEHGEHAAPMHEHHAGRGGHHDHHAHMVADFRKRFWISLVLTLPILALSPGLWSMLGLGVPLTFRGSHYVLFGFSSVVFFYGGWPFLKGFGEELRKRQPGMMTLIAVAISAAYFHSSAVTFGLSGMGFYWELATLIDIMLLGHWIEMKSVLGASGALRMATRK